MKQITIEMIRSWKPCYDPTYVDGVDEDWTGTVLDVLNSDIPHDDKLWLVLREELLPEAPLREFARWCASQVIDMWEAPDIVKEYLETGNEELRDAAWDAARDAARDAAQDAAQDAAWAAAWAAAWHAAWAAARYAARAAAWAAARHAAQTEKLIEMVEKLEVTNE